ncbi:MAG: UbiD family decarboxylase, partial [Candidatus Dormibacteraeota bacterium]|nr:UbiD family decarboxylase [Candidatus Dormibacteraeota bacterium]MBO0761317.1 UbiD family decarboxylase [Candidatus Dormibacteraeota bacterium]
MTAFADLRAYLERVAELGELRTVPGAGTSTDIGPLTEITAWSPEHPMLLFDDIPGFPRGWR